MKENEAHKKAYQFWYDLGVTRSYPQVARKFHVSTTSIKKWAKAHGWAERARLQEIANTNNELKRQAALKRKQDPSDPSLTVMPKDTYRKDIESTLKIIKATILSAIDPVTKRLKISTETPADINALANAYEKLAKLDLTMSENDVAETKNMVMANQGVKISRSRRYAGRKTKLTPEVQEKLIEAVRKNMTITRACLLCRITPRTYCTWKSTGEDERDRIVREVSKAERMAVESGELNPLDLLAMEEFIEKKLDSLNPNKFFYFFIEIKKAEAEAELENIAAIERARDGGEYVSEVHFEKNAKGKIIGSREVKKYLQPQWTAAAWMLERKHPDLYGRHVKYDGTLAANILNRNEDGNGRDIKDIKDEMQSKKRIAELAIILMRLAAQAKPKVEAGAGELVPVQGERL